MKKGTPAKKKVAEVPQPQKQKQKRKGLGGLSPEKKNLLKQLIMQKAAEDMKKQQEMAAVEKMKIIEARLPKLNIDGMDKKNLEKKVRDLYEIACRLEEEKYDWEMKLRRQSYEINELNVKVNDIKGHFVKPVLKKVSKTEQKLAKFDQEKTIKTKQQSFRENLKSTGQHKFALEDKEPETAKKPEWSRDQLKSKDSDLEDKKDGDAEDESEEEDEDE